MENRKIIKKPFELKSDFEITFHASKDKYYPLHPEIYLNNQNSVIHCVIKKGGRIGSIE